uniref:Bee-milk protein n=1 Tax=Plectus sambesii TaxID=2011161 RepID=A0A914XE07_9BILA
MFRYFIRTISLLLSFAKVSQAEIVANWTTLNFQWSSTIDRLAALQYGYYVPEHNIITNIKVFNDRIFVAVPRWFHGSPASLNEISSDRRNLLPYPSWGKNEAGKCHALQCVQSMEINPRDGTMWVIDVGSLSILDHPSGRRDLCPPKLVIIDLEQNKIIHGYTFDESVVSSSQNFLADIVIDPENERAYISNTIETSIVVFDKKTMRAWKVVHPTMRHEESARELMVNGIEFDGETGIDGIALSADYKTLYYSALNGKTVYSVPVEYLSTDTSPSTLDAEIKVAFERPTHSDGMIWSNRSLYFGGLQAHEVLKWTPDSNNGSIEVVIKDSEHLFWADSFAIDEKQNLWFTTNKLYEFFTPPLMNFSQGADANFRIWKIHIGEDSYLAKTVAGVSTALLANYLLIIAMNMLFFYEI